MSLASLLEGDPIPLTVKRSLLADVAHGLQFLLADTPLYNAEKFDIFSFNTSQKVVALITYCHAALL